MRKRIDITGQKFGRLIVIGFAEIRGNKICWLCRCNCGNETIVAGINLKSKNTQSCGCLQKELKILDNKKRKTHGLINTSEYHTWEAMKQRCLNPKASNYKNYGERGITICQEWIDSFETFYKDMGKRPSLKHSIERKNNNLGYYKENCKWSTKKEQNSNQRSNIKIINTETLEIYDTITNAAKSINICYSTLWGYLNGVGINKTKLKIYNE